MEKTKTDFRMHKPVCMDGIKTDLEVGVVPIGIKSKIMVGYWNELDF